MTASLRPALGAGRKCHSMENSPPCFPSMGEEVAEAVQQEVHVIAFLYRERERRRHRVAVPPVATGAPEPRRPSSPVRIEVFHELVVVFPPPPLVHLAGDHVFQMFVLPARGAFVHVTAPPLELPENGGGQEDIENEAAGHKDKEHLCL